jgi:hypothetical protein
MANKRVENYAYRHGTSNNEAKRRLGKGARHDTMFRVDKVIRGAPIAGTGKPKGVAKG